MKRAKSKENIDKNLMYLKKCVVSQNVLGDVHMVKEMRHLKYTILGVESYIRYAKYTAFHMPISKPILSETVTRLALIKRQ